jgi:hypothetical protein
MSTTFEKAQVGDKVWSVRYGHGIVAALYSDPDYPLVIKFTKFLNSKSYTLQGNEFHHELQTLFWQEIKFEVPKQPPRIKLINGIEVPDISFRPSINRNYFYPSLEMDLYNSAFFVRGNKSDEFRVDNGLCYPYTPEGKEAAILHTKALLGVK